jgi:anti-sigma B factor antagonist
VLKGLPPETFSVRAGSDPDDYVVAVYGEIDALTAPELMREIERGLAACSETVVVDLTSVRFIDSSGLHALVDAWRRAEQLGKSLRLLRPSPPVHRAFVITGLADRLPFAD